VLTILHISDLHFGPFYLPPIGEALLRIAPTLNADVIVASGDFTQRAKREQFAAAKEFLGRLPPLPLIVTPGNHDVPLYRVAERMLRPYDNYREFISPDLDSATRLKSAIFVSLNSAAPYTAITNGRIHRRQLQWAADQFDEGTRELIRIIVAHHHFAPAPDYEGGQVMPKAKRALDLFVRHRVDMILGGHLHRAYIGNSLDVYPGEDREHGIIIAQCGTTTSRRGRVREREKNSFNLITVTDATIHITQYMHFDDAGGFAPVSRHEFPRPGRRTYLV
jgi:3',5'-cyclic AMP phosphodiesterase CpdA